MKNSNNGFTCGMNRFCPARKACCRRLSWGGFLLFCFILCAVWVQAAEMLPAVSRISILSEPPGVQVVLDAQVLFRTVQVEANEVLIAFKGVRLSEKVRKQGKSQEGIRRVTIDRLPDDVVALRVVGNRKILEIRPDWDQRVNTLTVLLVFEKEKKPIPNKLRAAQFIKNRALIDKHAVLAASSVDASDPAEKISVKKPETVPEPPTDLKAESAPNASDRSVPDSVSEPEALPEKITPRAADSPTTRMTGSTDDLLRIMVTDSCRGRIDMQEAQRQCRKENWLKAVKILETGIQNGPEEAEDCLEEAYYLKAYAYYKMNQRGDDGLYLEALNYFQDAVSYFPSSVYAPYAMACMGKIYNALKNYAEAKGYFKIIQNSYKQYAGLPEVLYELGRLHAGEKNLKPCIAIFKEFLFKYPENQFALAVQLELGKALYEVNKYADALKMLNAVLAKDPRKAFVNKALLLGIGNCNYQLGKFVEARVALSKAYNFFPQAEDNPTSLTRIGDTYRDTDHLEKAKKIYQVVMDKYPGTDGYIISAIRRADLLETPAEMADVYKMIIDGYPDHPIANLAVVKLADLQYKAGEYRKSIESIRPLIIANTKDLMTEASYILESSFEGLISRLLKSDSYPEVVALHQKERGYLRRFDKPEIFQMLGVAYLRGHLHKEAALLLKKAEDLFGRNAPPELYYEIGVALQALDDGKSALARLEKYVRKAPRGEHLYEVQVRLGQLNMRQGDHKKALAAWKTAYRLSNDATEQISVLRLIAEANHVLGDYRMAVGMLQKAANLLAQADKKDAMAIADVKRQLGENYMKLNDYKKAAQAFSTALDAFGASPPPSVLVQLGEAYRNAGNRDQAKKAYARVLTLEDDFWKYLVQERLQRIAVESKMQTEGAIL